MNRLGLIFLVASLLIVASVSAGSIDRSTLRWMNKKPVIDSIVIEGNEAFSDGRIRSQMYSRVRNPWRALKRDRRSRLQRETPNRDTLEIKFLYLTNGYIAAKVVETFEVLLPDSSTLVRVRIDEGRCFVYGRRSVTGEFEDRFRADLHGPPYSLKQGEPVNQLDIRQAVYQMKELLANAGFPYAEVTFAIDTSATNDMADVAFVVNADKLTHFGSLQIHGIDRFPEYTARRELKIVPGAIYSRRAIIESKERLVESGYFSTHHFRQVESSLDKYRPDFILSVRERKSRYISAGAGAGQSETNDLVWDFSAGFGKRNLFGSRRIGLKAEYSLTAGQETRLALHRYRASFTEPWLLGFRMPLTLTGQVEPPLKSLKQDYDIRSWSLAASTYKKFGYEVRINLGFEYESVKITGIPAEEIEVRKEEDEISVRRKLYMSFRSDSRENIFLPRKGAVSDLRFEYYGGFLGGDASFVKAVGSWFSFQEVWPGWVSATRFKVGMAREFGESEDVPREDRLYLGGANSVRAFKENSLGPQRETGHSDGANYLLLTNQEFRWRTFQLFAYVPFLKAWPLWQSIFFDAGEGFVDLGEVKVDNLAFAYGVGLQLVSPAGPIRLDYARRIRTHKFDFEDRLHFTILYAF